jgi:hypothetical protein
MLKALGLSGVGLASIATGLPVSFLRNPRAHAAEPEMCPAADRQQYLIFSGRDSGDPFNANVPGTYDDPDIVHPDGAAFAGTNMMLGGVATKAAQLWSTLPQWALDRSAFVHHATKTQVHGELVKVLQLLGDAYKAETIPSIFAKRLGPCLGSVATQPVPVGDVTMSFEGRTLPRLKPTTLRELLVADDSPLLQLQSLRDRSMDEIRVTMRDDLNAAQRAFVGNLAKAREDVRGMADGAMDLLADVTNDNPSAQIRAAVALIKLNLTPCVAISLPFGSDNHNDDGLQKEIDEHTTGIGYIAELMNLLQANGLEDRVTFASINVFGRTLMRDGQSGRSHWSSHHVTMMTGKYVLPGVMGGVTREGADYSALPIDSNTGAGTPDGDISYEDGLPSMAKTLGAVLGLDDAVLDEEVLKGKVIRAAVA